MKLRIVGMITFLIYLLSVMFTASETTSYIFTQVQQLLTFTSVVSFAMVMALQVYRFYIKTFVQQEEEDQ